MLRGIWLCLFLGFVGHATGALAVVQGGACVDACPDEDAPERHCTPACTDCLCGAPLAIAFPVASFTAEADGPPPGARSSRPLPFRPTPPELPDPRRLLRVPK